MVFFFSESKRFHGLIACGAGFAATLGFAPHHWLLFFFPSLALFLWSIDRPDGRDRFLNGYLFGVGHFSFGLKWLFTTLHTHSGVSPAGALFILLSVTAILSLYPALFAYFLPRLARGNPLLTPIAAATLWPAGEWLRANLLSGFAWNPFGQIWIDFPALSQLAQLGGVYLLSGLAMLPGAALAAVLKKNSSRSQRSFHLGTLLLFFAAAQGYGDHLLDRPEPVQKTTLKVALVQANIPQESKWEPAFREPTRKIYQRLVDSISEPVDLIIWPETALPFMLQDEPEAWRQLSALVERSGAPILTGMWTHQTDEGGISYYNSLVLVNPDGPDLAGRYDKRHLVPLAEYIPFSGLFPETAHKLTHGLEDFSPGPGPKLISTARGGLGPIICYEAIFPDQVRALAALAPGWLVNATNDGWFSGDAKRQHLQMARMRAIENRLPLIRVANTGISAVFNAKGAPLATIDANVRGVQIVTIQAGPGNSPFQRVGASWIGMMMLLIPSSAALLNVLTRSGKGGATARSSGHSPHR